ncbi:MAG: DUF6019 family protein [Acutalibacter sp.]
MEDFGWNLLLWIIILCVLYFLIKAAVRDGMLEYDKLRRQQDNPPEPPGELASPMEEEKTQQAKKEDG